MISANAGPGLEPEKLSVTFDLMTPVNGDRVGKQMNGCTIIRRGKEGIAWSGLALALCLAGGCEPPASHAVCSGQARGQAPPKPMTPMPRPQIPSPLMSPLSRICFRPKAGIHSIPLRTGAMSKWRFPRPPRLRPSIRSSTQSGASIPAAQPGRINNEIVEEGEEASIRTPSGDKIHFKCIHIGKNLVDVLIQGQAEPKRLIMQQKKELTNMKTDSRKHNVETAILL